MKARLKETGSLKLDVELAVTVGFDKEHYEDLLKRVDKAEQDSKRYRAWQRAETGEQLCSLAEPEEVCENCPVNPFCGPDPVTDMPTDRQLDVLVEFLEGQDEV